MAFNSSKAPFDNVDVRRALNYAVDKKSIAKNVLFDTVDVMDSPLQPPSTATAASVPTTTTHRRRRNCCAAAGVTNLSVTFGTPSGRYLQDKQAAQAIAANLRRGGDRRQGHHDRLAVVRPGDDAAGRAFDMHMLGWAPGALDAPTQFQMFQKAQWPPTGLATAFYTNESVEALIDAGNRELDEQKRSELYCQAQKQIWDDAPWVFLWSQTLILAYSSDIEGVSFVPNEKFDTVYARPKS